MRGWTANKWATPEIELKFFFWGIHVTNSPNNTLVKKKGNLANNHV